MRGEIRQQGDGFLSFFDDEQDKNKLFLEQKIVSNRRPLAAFFAWFFYSSNCLILLSRVNLQL